MAVNKIIFIILFFTSFIFANNSMDLTYKDILIYKKKYGDIAHKRIKVWDNFIKKSKNSDLLSKLKNTNNFVNRLSFKEDIDHWGKERYDANIFEFLSTAAGDDNDFIALKKITLMKLGISEKKLKIYKVQIRVKNRISNHKILAYIHRKNQSPIILDNINKNLNSLDKRFDIVKILEIL